jgi:hypothetical protein
MAVSKHSNNHAAQFVSTLTRNQRNALRAILLHESGTPDLRHALGINKARTIPEHEHRTGLARTGRTSELFHVATAANIPLH